MEPQTDKKVATRPMSKTARLLVEAATEARLASIEAANLRANERFVHAAEIDEVDPTNAVQVDGGRWVIPQ